MSPAVHSTREYEQDIINHNYSSPLDFAMANLRHSGEMSRPAAGKESLSKRRLSPLQPLLPWLDASSETAESLSTQSSTPNPPSLGTPDTTPPRGQGLRIHKRLPMRGDGADVPSKDWPLAGLDKAAQAQSGTNALDYAQQPRAVTWSHQMPRDESPTPSLRHKADVGALRAVSAGWVVPRATKQHVSTGADLFVPKQRTVDRNGVKTANISASTSSAASTVVQATLVIRSRLESPKLRKVSKTETLRADARQSKHSPGSSDVDSPLESQGRNSKGARRFSFESASEKSEVRVARQRSDARQAVSLGQDVAQHPDTSSWQTPKLPGAYPSDTSSTPKLAAVGSSATMTPSALSQSPAMFYDAVSQLSLGRSPDPAPTSNGQLKTPLQDPSFSRTSFEQSPRQRLDPSLLHSNLTLSEAYRFSPLSTRSGFTEIFEVREAAAINIFPHNNDSLLIVHHVPESEIHLHRPLVTLSEESGSQSGTTREAPVVSVIPPTPARELESSGESAAQRPPMSVQRPSFLQRARRYSDLLLSGNSRRSNARDGPTTHSPKRPPSVSEQASSLHPFWHPRGFWNDLSDDEDGAAENDQPVDVRPQTGTPTANIRSEWRRGNSIRGFLIGNSLGLERGPTNKRRPFIVLPSNKKPGKDEAKVQQPITVRASARHSAEQTRPRHARTSSSPSIFTGWRAKLKSSKGADAEEAAREHRREFLRQNIQAQVPNRSEPLDC